VDVTAVFSADTTSTSADSTKLTADTVTISTPVTGTGNLVILPDRANLIKRSQELDS
jgi:lipopolysaccharide export system protein LptA